jgi:hypothetical protein
VSSPQPPYGQQQPPPSAYDWTPTPPPHPQATASMVMGLVGLIGMMFCGGLTLVISPFAWVLGSKAVREIDLTPGSYGGREMAVAGKVMGIIGTVLLVIGIVAIVLLVVWFFSLDDASFES